MGKLKRFFKALRHLDYNFARLNDQVKILEQRADQTECGAGEMERRVGEMERRADETEQKSAESEQREKELVQRITQNDIRLNSTEEALRWVTCDNDSYALGIVEKITCCREAMLLLNRELSISPTIWGPRERLHISPLAAVNSCFFNTNSGSITVGDYTYAGSNVSVLAGSHDQNLTGFLRRDAEMTEGCDILIEEGVWLASNSVVLGPCRIEKNAVIAAGAVVTPGTVVPAETIYGGIPAKQIGTIQSDIAIDREHSAIQKALGRNNGVLFTEGWSEKKIFPDSSLIGHYLIKPEGTVLTNKEKLCLTYASSETYNGKILLKYNNENITVKSSGLSGEQELLIPFEEERTKEIKISTEPFNPNLCIALFPGREE